MNNNKVLTPIDKFETEKLAILEGVIERGLQTFTEVGNALLEIRDSRLYRAEYSTFEEYCRERWGMVRRQADRLIEAAEVVENLRPIGLIPANEAQARPLAGLTPQLQRTIWPIIVDTAPNGKVTANHVQKVVDDYLRPDEHLDAALADESKPVCPECGQVYDGSGCPDCHPQNGFNYKRDTRRSVAADIYTPQGMDACQTPPYAIDPLLPYLQEGWNIWEPACGEGLLVEALYDSGYAENQIITGDILAGRNFFNYEPAEWDCLVTNPPYSIQFQWLERCYQLGKPFALLLKVEILGTKTAQELMQQYGFEILLLDKRVDFKMPNLGWGDGERKSAAQFPTFWLCWKLLPEQVIFGKLDKKKQDDYPAEV